MYCGPDLCRVDTFSNFQGTIDSADLDIAVSDIDETPRNTTEDCPATTPLPPSIARGDTADRVGSLEEVADAFAAVESAGCSTPRLVSICDKLTPSSNAGLDCGLVPVRRIDTLELLAFPVRLSCLYRFLQARLILLICFRMSPC